MKASIFILQILSLIVTSIYGFTINTVLRTYPSRTAGVTGVEGNSKTRTSLNLLDTSNGIDITASSSSNIIAQVIEETTASASATATQIQQTTDFSTNTAGLSASTNTIVFIIGLIPFLWATYEFWSRIAVGASFGTGKDSIQIKPSSEGMKSFTTIGKDGDLKASRGQQVLGDDALLVAYFLFAVAIGSVGIAVYSVITSPMSTASM
jgi:hypothetical protein